MNERFDWIETLFQKRPGKFNKGVAGVRKRHGTLVKAPEKFYKEEGLFTIGAALFKKAAALFKKCSPDLFFCRYA